MAARSKALRDFQGDPPTTIFLLSLRAGAVGINLTEANRVFLMEPALNPALEAQAIGRVHRLGQVNQVQVIRLAMRDSIEERILKVHKKKYGATAVGANDGATSSEGGGATSEGGNEAESERVTRSNPEGAGHLTRDKVEAKTDEFDALFGVTEEDIQARS